MNLVEYLRWLEPDAQLKRGPAVCMSSEDFAKIPTFIEQACRKLGDGVCVKEITPKVDQAVAEVEALKARSISIKSSQP